MHNTGKTPENQYKTFPFSENRTSHIASFCLLMCLDYLDKLHIENKIKNTEEEH